MRRAMGPVKCYAVRLKNFWISLLGLASAIILLWWVNPVEDMNLYLKVVVTLLYMVLAVFSLMDGFKVKQQDRKFAPPYFVATIISSGFFVIALAYRANMPAVVVNVFSIMASLPPLWILWKLTKGKWLLLFATVLLIFVTSVYLVPPITPAGLTLFLVPLPVVSYVLIVWALVTMGLLTLARRWRWCPVWGPAMEFASMLLIAAPLVALTMLAANALGFGDIGVAVFGVIAGILFGNAVSTPLRQFLLALGDLSQCRCEGGHKVFTLWR